MLRILVLTLVAAVLAGCAGASRTYDLSKPMDRFRFGLLTPTQQEAVLTAPGGPDEAKCKGLGFKPGTDGYGNCRLKLEQIRATERATLAADRAVIESRRTKQNAVQHEAQGRKVYDADECIGPVIMGECKGSILPKKAHHPTCHGEWLNGRCTGPMF